MKAPDIASLIISSVVLLGCTDNLRNEPTAPAITASAVAQASSGNLVTGNGQITVGGERRKIAFAAVRHHDGSVSGEYELNGLGTRMRAQILCFTVTYGNSVFPSNAAQIGGVVEQATDPAILGHDIGLVVADAPDRLSPPLIFRDLGPVIVFGDLFPDIATAFCAGAPVTSAGDLPLYRIENGNIGIH